MWTRPLGFEKDFCIYMLCVENHTMPESSDEFAHHCVNCFPRSTDLKDHYAVTFSSLFTKK
jgi:hypothetical protein